MGIYKRKQESKKERKKTRSRPRKRSRKKRKFFLSFFLGFFLGRERVFFCLFFLDRSLGRKRFFLFSFINSHHYFRLIFENFVNSTTTDEEGSVEHLASTPNFSQYQGIPIQALGIKL